MKHNLGRTYLMINKMAALQLSVTPDNVNLVLESLSLSLLKANVIWVWVCMWDGDDGLKNSFFRSSLAIKCILS